MIMTEKYEVFLSNYETDDKDKDTFPDQQRTRLVPRPPQKQTQKAEKLLEDNTSDNVELI